MEKQSYVIAPRLQELHIENFTVTDFALSNLNKVIEPQQAKMVVAPCIMNPQANGFGMAKVKGQHVLTHNQHVVWFPNHEVDPELTQELNLWMGACQQEQHPLQWVDAYSAPCNYDKAEQRFNSDAHGVYRYHGQEYVSGTWVANAERHWYKMQPVPVERTKNGNLQIQTGLFIADYTDYQAMNQWLSTKFLNELRYNSQRLRYQVDGFQPEHLQTKQTTRAQDRMI